MFRVTRSKTANDLERIELFCNAGKFDDVISQLKEFNCNIKGKEPILRDRLLRHHKKVIGLPDINWNPIEDSVLTEVEIEDIVKKLDAHKIVESLKANNCSTQGSLHILRNRLTRFYLKSKGFQTRWTEKDVKKTDSRTIRQDSEDCATDSSSMSVGKNSKNYTSARSKKNKSKAKSKSKTQNMSSQEKETNNENTDTRKEVPTETLQATNTNNNEPQNKSVNDKELPKDDGENPKINEPITMQNLREVISVILQEQSLKDLRSRKSSATSVASTSSKASFATSTVQKGKKKSRKSVSPKLSPIRKLRDKKSESSDSESDDDTDELDGVLKRLKIRIPPKKTDPKSKKKRNKKHLSNDSVDESSDSRSSKSHDYRRKSKKSPKLHRRRRRGRSYSTSSSSSSSSDSDSSDLSSCDSRSRKKSRDLTQTYKIIKSFDLKFDGKESENAELFLEELMDCVKNSSLDKKRALKAIPRLLSGQAKKWYQGEKHYIHTWSDFKKKFKKRFIPLRDDGDIYEDLYGRTQGEDESIAEFINNIKLIAAYFRHPPAEKSLVKLTIKNLLPKYRSFIRDKTIKTFDKLQKYGQKYERELEANNRYTPPKAKDLMHIKYAAYKAKEKPKKHVAASKETVAATIVASEGKKNKPKPQTQITPVNPTAATVQKSATQTLPPGVHESKPPRKPFPANCRLCDTFGHRAFHCPTRNGRIVCWGCGELDILYPNCTKCQSRREAAENAKQSNDQSPAVAQTK